MAGAPLASMSLRLRVLLAIVAVLASGSGLGLALAGWQVRAWLLDELWSAQLSAHLEVARSFVDLREAKDPRRELTGLIATFNGNRHLQAVLVAPDGKVIAASEIAPAQAPPAWFSALLHNEIAPARLVAPGAGGAAIELRPVYADDLAAVWAEFVDLALMLAVASVVGAGLIFVMVGQALRPLRAVGEALPRIGAGDYAARVPQTGPPELAALGRGVNEMAGRLAAMRDRNRALEEQMLTLQDEERADIARDLHDEIGPHLFAANVDAAMAASLISAGRPEAALEQVRAITAAIAHIQRLVRDMLARLRPAGVAELGLPSAVDDLAAFWQARQPGLVVEIELPDDEALPTAAQETLYRVVQESLSNAVRHGAPGRIRIAIGAGDEEAWAEIVNDGAAPDPGGRGYGLAGMAERLAAAGGTLAAGPAGDGVWRVTARLPLVARGRSEAA